MRKPASWIVLIVLIAAAWFLHLPGAKHGTPTAPSAQNATASNAGGNLPAFLPPEARTTLALIASRGPFPHPQDGTVFGNREGLLPQKPGGYYHEYTVDTPGLDYRGARRIIAGGTPPEIYYYTDDHYRSFHAFTVNR